MAQGCLHNKNIQHNNIIVTVDFLLRKDCWGLGVDLWDEKLVDMIVKLPAQTTSTMIETQCLGEVFCLLFPHQYLVRSDKIASYTDLDTSDSVENIRRIFITTALEYLLLNTFEILACIEIHQRRGPDKHFLQGFLLPEIYQLSHAKIDVQPLCMYICNE